MKISSAKKRLLINIWILAGIGGRNRMVWTAHSSSVCSVWYYVWLPELTVNKYKIYMNKQLFKTSRHKHVI